MLESDVLREGNRLGRFHRAQIWVLSAQRSASTPLLPAVAAHTSQVCLPVMEIVDMLCSAAVK